MEHSDVLIVEDDASLSEALRDTLELAGYSVICAADGVDALQKLAIHRVRLVISDVQMERMDGLALLENLGRRFRNLPVLLMTAYGTIQKAVQAMKLGAVDYLVKPFEAETLLAQVQKHMDTTCEYAPELEINDPAMRRLYELAAKVSRVETTVLIQGESGTGKEVLARYIHDSSWRNAGPFIAINCAAIPDNMLEAILFGYERGAFTGAYQAKPGKFELAQGGTLLLDEISEMDTGLQAKLLRVLQEREVERLGGSQAIDLDVRVLATTNRDLKEEIPAGRFREDLYYRLNVFPLTIPPLRERKSDILPLAAKLLQRHWPGGKPLPVFDESAHEYLLSHDWPGNVRELENAIQRALVFQSGGVVSVGDLLIQGTRPVPSGEDLAVDEVAAGALQNGLKSAEEQLILDALQEENGSRKLTADRLGISPRTLRYKIARMRKAGVVLPL